MIVGKSLQADALGPQDAGHAADATGRRAFSCPRFQPLPVY